MAKVSGELQPLVKDSTQTMKRYLVAKAAFTLREEHIPEEHIERQASHFSSRSSRVLTSGEVVGFGGLWSGGGVRYGTGAAARRERGRCTAGRGCQMSMCSNLGACGAAAGQVTNIFSAVYNGVTLAFFHTWH